MKIHFFVLMFLLSASLAKSQSLIRGIVIDSATFQSLPYVNVQVKNGFRGTATDAKGSFSIQANGSDTLLISLVGYKTLELPLSEYEAGLIRLAEKPTVLPQIDIVDKKNFSNPYEGMFDDQIARLRKRIPFYYHKSRKDKIKAANWREESERVQTYVNVIINDSTTRADLMKTHHLTEQRFFEVLTKFNEKHYEIMYFLTEGELRSLLNNFFEANSK